MLEANWNRVVMRSTVADVRTKKPEVGPAKFFRIIMQTRQTAAGFEKNATKMDKVSLVERQV